MIRTASQYSSHVVIQTSEPLAHYPARAAIVDMVTGQLNISNIIFLLSITLVYSLLKYISLSIHISNVANTEYLKGSTLLSDEINELHSNILCYLDGINGSSPNMPTL